MKNILTKIRVELKANSDKEIKVSAQRFFKEGIKLYGMKNAVADKIAKKHWPDIKRLSKKKIFLLCEELLKSGYQEECYVVCVWLPKIVKQFELGDLEIFERWIDEYIDNWAKCDTFCNHTVGDFIMKYPNKIDRLKKWAKSENRWMKRAAAVTLIIPARRGLFLKEIFEIANILLLDQDDLVQKGYGWMLKAASEAHQKEVLEYVLKHKHEMPRTALRYAIEKMTPEMRKEAMDK